jgi:hypothetical protein
MNTNKNAKSSKHTYHDKKKQYDKKQNIKQDNKQITYGDEKRIKRIHSCMKNKINFISGTISPAQANRNKEKIHTIDDLECLETGLLYLFEKYDKNLSLSIQPKYMGSRINMYLFRDNHETKSYCVTRNGFICNIEKEDLIPLYDQMYNKLIDFMTQKQIYLIIIDGELLPWSALGKRLIENEFLPVDKGIEVELQLMKKYNFDHQLEILKMRNKNDEFKDVQENETKDSDENEINESNIIEKSSNAEHNLVLEQTLPLSQASDDLSRTTNILTTTNTNNISKNTNDVDVTLIHDSQTLQKMYDVFHEQMKLYAGYTYEPGDNSNGKPHDESDVDK